MNPIGAIRFTEEPSHKYKSSPKSNDGYISPIELTEDEINLIKEANGKRVL